MEDSEAALAERIYARVKRRLILWYVVSLLVAAAAGGALAWQHVKLQELSDARIAEYRRLVAEKLKELHQLDLQAAAYLTRRKGECPKPLSRADAQGVLAEAFGHAPEPRQVDLLLDQAKGFGMCQPAELRRVLDDPAGTASVDTIFQIVLKRPADTASQFTYGHWLQSGMEVEAIARDLMASPEFEAIRKQGDWHQAALRDLAEAGVSEYRLIVGDNLEERHAADLEDVARRTRPTRDCAQPPPRAEVVRLLADKLGYTAQDAEVDQLVAKAVEFGLCDMVQIQQIFDDVATMASVDTLYHILLRRPPDPFGRLTYGYWKIRGVEIEAAARDIMSSTEFQKLRKLGES